jgi:hypothetical protein
LILGGEEETMREPELILEECNDPLEVARMQATMERLRRNSDWLQAHWPALLPQARGKLVAVAGQEAFVADSINQAWAWVDATHPEDDGAFVRYVPTEEGPRIYANFGRVASK